MRKNRFVYERMIIMLNLILPIKGRNLSFYAIKNVYKKNTKKKIKT